MKKLSMLLATAIVAVQLLLSSCCPKVTEALSTSEKTVHDSSSTDKDSTWYQDTLLKLHGEINRLRGMVRVDQKGLPQMDTLSVETPKSKATASVKNGKLSVDCECKDMELQLKIKNRLVTAYKRVADLKQREKVTLQTREVPFTPWWVKLLAWAGGISLLLILLYAAYRYGKFLILKKL